MRSQFHPRPRRSQSCLGLAGWTVLFAALFFAACSGSSDGVQDPNAEPPTIEPSTNEATVPEEPQLAVFAARALGTTPDELSLGRIYDVAGTTCQAQVLGIGDEPIEWARHFVLAPGSEIIAGGEPGAVGRALRSCYDAADVEITSEQLIELILNLGHTPKPISEIDGSFVGMFRDAGIEYEPPVIERDGDDLSFAFWARDDEFGDLIKVTAERSGSSELIVSYEVVDRAP